jgi:hypothetical protein
MLKKELINDIFNIVMPNDWLKNKHKVGADTCKDTRVGFFPLKFLGWEICIVVWWERGEELQAKFLFEKAYRGVEQSKHS